MGITQTKWSRPVVVADVDGVFADFVFSQTIQLKKMFGHPCFPISSFEKNDRGLESLGLTEKHEDEFWDWVREQAKDFWESEREMVPGDVSLAYGLSHDCTWYFCTTRDDCRTGTAQRQTRNWLRDKGFFDPNVVVSDRKGDFCYSVRATYFVDDKFKNCQEVRAKSPETEVFFLALPAQQQYREQALEEGMWIVQSTNEFFNEMKTHYRLNWPSNDE